MSEDTKKRNLLKENKGLLVHKIEPSGRVRGNVHLNPTQNGQMFSVSLFRSYEDKQTGERKFTSSFGSRDLGDVQTVARRGDDYCAANRDREVYEADEPSKDQKDAKELAVKQSMQRTR